MYKFIYTTILFASLCFQGFSQSNTITVTVKEEVQLPVSEYIYTVSNNKSGSNNPFGIDFGDLEELEDEDETDMDDIIPIPPKSIQEMAKELKSYGFKCEVKACGEYDVNPEQMDDETEAFDREEIEVRVGTLNDLNRLGKVVLKMDDAYGELTGVEFAELSSMNAEVFPKMMQQAKDKASMIAATANKKIGEVVTISEGNGGNALYGDEMMELMQPMLNIQKKMWGGKVPTSRSKSITMTYVFEMK